MPLYCRMHLFLLLISVALQSVQSQPKFFCRSHSTARLAFAAGGGFGSSSSAKKNSEKKKLKKRTGFIDIEQSLPKTKEKDEPKLDKWGLPIPTDDELFPPMPDGTELIAAPSGKVSLAEIEESMKDHITLAYKNFNEHGVERFPSPGNAPMQLKLLHKSPPVLVVENFFTKEECEATQAVTQADVFQVNSATFSPLAQSKRTSTSWFCYYKQMPTLVAKAHYRLGIPLEQMEEPQIVRYRKGEEFSWHYDEVPSTELENGGQRIATLLVYLNTVQRGGGTIFRDLKDANGDILKFTPVQGSALLFFPAFADGRPDDRTLHKGQVAEDTKWITQMWIHQRAYKPVVPEGNTHEAAQDALAKVSEKLGYP